VTPLVRAGAARAPRAGGGGGPVFDYAIWDAATAGANISLSNGNLTATRAAGSAWQSVRATKGKSSGKWYWEYTFTGVANEIIMGAGDSALSASNFVGSSSQSTGFQAATSFVDVLKYRSATFTGTGAGLWVAGDVIMFALNMDNNKIWFGKNGTWLGAGSPNPATDTAPAFTGVNGTQYAATSMFAARAVTANFGASAFAHTPPAGFNAGLYDIL
jgi:hypothetical protein